MFRTYNKERAGRKNNVVMAEATKRANESCENFFRISTSISKNILRPAGADQRYGALVVRVSLLHAQGLPRAFVCSLGDAKRVFPRLAVGRGIRNAGNFTADVQQCQSDGEIGRASCRERV